MPPRAALLCLVLLFACRPEPDAGAVPLDPGTDAPMEAPALLRPPDGAMVTPFGRALDSLDLDVARLLYPELLANAAAPEDLLRLLPDTLPGYGRREVFAGIHEDSDSSWVGAIAIYRGDRGRLSLMLRDTGWDPIASNMLAARSVPEEALPDGRPLSRVTPVDRGGQHVQLGVGGAGRIVLQGHLAGIEDAALIAVLTAIDPKPIAALEASTGTARGAWPASPRQPDPEALVALPSPERLAAALPDAPTGWKLVAEGHGYRRGDARQLLAEATRSWSGPGGVLRASVCDLGPPDAPVTVEESAWSQDDAPGLRESLKADGAARCSEELATCKWMALRGDRTVLSLSGPTSLGPAGLEALAAGFSSVAD